MPSKGEFAARRARRSIPLTIEEKLATRADSGGIPAADVDGFGLLATTKKKALSGLGLVARPLKPSVQVDGT